MPTTIIGANESLLSEVPNALSKKEEKDKKENREQQEACANLYETAMHTWFEGEIRRPGGKPLFIPTLITLWL